MGRHLTPGAAIVLSSDVLPADSEAGGTVRQIDSTPSVAAPGPRIDRVVLLTLVSFDRWTPAAEISAQLGTTDSLVRSALADAIAEGALIDASSAGYRRYTESDAEADVVPLPPLSIVAQRSEARIGATTLLASALRSHRIAAGLSQNAVARGAKVDPAYVNRLERGIQTGQPSRHVMLSFAEAFGLDGPDTDRLLFVAGLAPVRDYQTLYEYVRHRLDIIDRALIGLPSDVVTRDGQGRSEAVS